MTDADDDPCVYVSTALPLGNPEAPPNVKLHVKLISVYSLAFMEQILPTSLLPTSLLSSPRCTLNMSSYHVDTWKHPVRALLTVQVLKSIFTCGAAAKADPSRVHTHTADAAYRLPGQTNDSEEPAVALPVSQPAMTDVRPPLIPPDGLSRWMPSPDSIDSQSGQAASKYKRGSVCISCRGWSSREASQQMAGQLTMQDHRDCSPNPSSAGMLGPSVPCWRAGSCELLTAATLTVQPPSSPVSVHLQLLAMSSPVSCYLQQRIGGAQAKCGSFHCPLCVQAH